MRLSRPVRDPNQGDKDVQILTRLPQSNNIEEEYANELPTEDLQKQAIEVEETNILSEKPQGIESGGGLGIVEDGIGPDIQDIQQQYEQLGPEGLAQAQQAILDLIQTNAARGTSRGTAGYPSRNPAQSSNLGGLPLEAILQSLGITIDAVRTAIDTFGVDLAVGGIQDLLTPPRLQRELNLLTGQEIEDLQRHPSSGLSPHRLANLLTRLRIKKLVRGLPRNQRTEIIAREATPAARERIFAREIVSEVVNTTTGLLNAESAAQVEVPQNLPNQASSTILMETKNIEQSLNPDVANNQPVDTSIPPPQSGEGVESNNILSGEDSYESEIAGLPMTIQIASGDFIESDAESNRDAVEEELDVSVPNSGVSQHTVLQNFYGMIDAMHRASRRLPIGRDLSEEPIDWHLPSGQVQVNTDQLPVISSQPLPE
ncbi:hypothetical protein ABW21_db0200369 [Orbilia brochopaga]|nr:hypothetical protein ABW21_db0200369 [Drechslerella brochopaga]